MSNILGILRLNNIVMFRKFSITNDESNLNEDSSSRSSGKHNLFHLPWSSKKSVDDLTNGSSKSTKSADSIDKSSSSIENIEIHQDEVSVKSDNINLSEKLDESEIDSSGFNSLKYHFFNRFFGKSSQTSSNKSIKERALRDPTIRLDNQNMWLTVIFALSFAIFVFSLFSSFLHVLISFVIKGECSDSINTAIVSIKVAIQMSIILLIFYFTAHRFTAYIACIIGRHYLRKLLVKADISDKQRYESWDIHVGWLSYRGPIDKSEIVLSNVVWRNPSGFCDSPFMIHIKEISVSLSLVDLYYTITYNSTLKFKQAILDHVEIYFTKPSSVDASNSLNVWSAIGLSNKDEENNLISSFISFIISKIKHKMSITHAIQKKFQHASHENVLDYEEEEEEDNEDDLPILSNTKHSHKMNTGKLCVELQRLLLFDLIVHANDLLSATHMVTSDSTDIKIPLFTMSHRELSGKPKYKNGPRVPLEGSKFGDKFGEKFGAELFLNNRLRISALLSSTALNNIAAGVHK